MLTKHYKILIPETVKIALRQQADYIKDEQHSLLNASKWLDGMIKAIESLAEFPDRCPIAPENFYIKRNSQIIIRHFIYKKTFRIIFAVVKNEVRILSIKHSAQLPF